MPADNWTVDASGHYVDWTQPPYTAPGSQTHDLVLPGEDRHKIEDSELEKRRAEYMKLVRRNMDRG